MTAPSGADEKGAGMSDNSNGYWTVTGDQAPKLCVLDVASLSRDLGAVHSMSTPQQQYDAAHDPSDYHCLSTPCSYHPGEARITPAPVYPARFKAAP